jgi:16S rRNA (cytosine967-C5)-methyltransferase
VEVLVEKQRALLAAAWPLLEPGGYLLYSTCSLLKAENSAQLEHFCSTVADAVALPLQVASAENCEVGVQLFPTAKGPDGFYYALLHKRP